MSSIEQTRAKIAANFPKDPKQKNELRWERESLHTLVTTCMRYRICRLGDEATRTYSLELTATTTRPGKKIDGPFYKPEEAKAAAQLHFAQGVLPL